MTMPIPIEIKKLFSAVRILGNGDDRVTLSENELFCLLTQCCCDLSMEGSVSQLPPLSAPAPSSDYYRLPLAWFQTPQTACPSATALVESLAACIAHEPDFRPLLREPRRAPQASPQVSAHPVHATASDDESDRAAKPPGIGGVHHELLAAWLVWRKWIFDVDNRAGTGSVSFGTYNSKYQYVNQ